MQNKIVFLDALSLGESNIQSRLESFGAYTAYPTTKPEETLQRSKGANIILSNKVVLNKEILEALKQDLKLICITATGTNNVDLEAAKALGITVKNVAGYSTQSVAQHTLMLALGLCAKLPFYDSYVKSREYANNPLFTNLSLPLELLNGKNWGIIGLGSIGKEVARLASAFGARVYYYSTSGKNNNTDYPSLPLEELLKTSFVVSIHAPLNSTTQNLLSAKNLSLLQENSILINIGRGGIVNEEDLAQALKQQRFYVGLDVFTKEPMQENNPLLDKSIAHQLLLTPHNAWGYEQSKEALIEGIVKNIKEFLTL